MRNIIYWFAVASMALLSMGIQGYVTFINTTSERLILQLLTPARNKNDNPVAPVFVEEFILWENGSSTAIDTSLGARNRIANDGTIPEKAYTEYESIWGKLRKHYRPAAAFTVNGFFCFNTECENDICGVVGLHNCDWIETQNQFIPEDGKTYIISCTDDNQLMVNAKTERHEWRLNEMLIVGTYFTVPGKVN